MGIGPLQLQALLQGQPGPVLGDPQAIKRGLPLKASQISFLVKIQID
jgi:hypothetical protein